MRSLIGTLVVITATQALAQQRPDFTGEWVLNRTASALQGESGAVTEGTLRIDHRDPEFQFARRFVVNGQPANTTFDIRTDGSELARAEGPRRSRSRLEWQGSSLLLTALIDTPAGTVSNVVRYELLDGDRVLRAVEDVSGGQVRHHNVWIFDRQ